MSHCAVPATNKKRRKRSRVEYETTQPTLDCCDTIMTLVLFLSVLIDLELCGNLQQTIMTLEEFKNDTVVPTQLETRPWRDVGHVLLSFKIVKVKPA